MGCPLGYGAGSSESGPAAAALEAMLRAKIAGACP